MFLKKRSSSDGLVVWLIAAGCLDGKISSMEIVALLYLLRARSLLWAPDEYIPFHSEATLEVTYEAASCAMPWFTSWIGLLA